MPDHLRFVADIWPICRHQPLLGTLDFDDDDVRLRKRHDRAEHGPALSSFGTEFPLPGLSKAALFWFRVDTVHVLCTCWTEKQYNRAHRKVGSSL